MTKVMIPMVGTALSSDGDACFYPWLMYELTGTKYGKFHH